MNYSITLPRQGLSAEILTRGTIVVAFTILLWRSITAYWVAPNNGLLLFLLSEFFTMGLVIFARLPKQANRSAYTWLLVAVSIGYALAIELDSAGTMSLAPLYLTLPLQVFGFGFQLIAKWRLGRSFGLLPEERGLVTGGVYRWVRHPMYLGYLINHIGFLLSHFTLQNLVVLAILYVCQILRIVEEEKILQTNPDYQHYMQKTRYRLVPLLY